ncbi:MAG: hypothetical protein IKF83_01640 [Clostridia bacterium]|nr:hypothetical protein [Clostridia bacterium]
MAGYVIHLAVAEEYIKNYNEDIDNYDEFIQGVIFPDSVSDKSLTHYGPKSSKPNLKTFLFENNIDNNFNKGYFLHLITDYIFYNKFIEYYSTDIYNDYDILNNSLIKKFNVKLPEEVKNKVFYKEGKTKILELNSTIKFIEDVGKYRLKDIKSQILNEEKYWSSFKNLIHK